MEVSVTERYALLQRRAKDIGCEVRVTLFTTSLEVGSEVTVVKSVPEPDGLEAALDVLEAWIADPETKAQADLNRRLREARMKYVVAGLEYATLSHQAREGIDKAVSDALNAEGDAWQREQDSTDEQDETPTREDQS